MMMMKVRVAAAETGSPIIVCETPVLLDSCYGLDFPSYFGFPAEYLI